MIAPRPNASAFAGSEGLEKLVGAAVGSRAVGMTVEGAHVMAAFEPDLEEVHRRASAGLGAVRSLGLLHGLWLLPHGLPTPIADVPEVKQRRLNAAHGLVDVAGRSYLRTYNPPGSVRTMGFGGRRFAYAVAAASRFTPIVQRIAYSTAPVPPSPRQVTEARMSGVGVAVWSSQGEAGLVLEPAQAVVGVPSVYRWWLAELAFAAWVMRAPNLSAELSDPAAP